MEKSTGVQKSLMSTSHAVQIAPCTEIPSAYADRMYFLRIKTILAGRAAKSLTTT
jgi:hypothetical protein